MRSLLTCNLCLCLAGQTAAAAELYGNWTAAWDRFGWLPEQFDMTMSTVHPIEKVLPVALRPAADRIGVMSSWYCKVPRDLH